MSLEAAKAAVPQILKEAQNQVGSTISGFVGEHMRFVGQGSEQYPNTTDQLQTVSGTLFQSLIPEKKNSILRELDKSEKVVIEYGSSVVYAAIHEYGGNAGRGHKARIRPRPYFSLAIEDYKNSSKPEEILAQATKKALTILFQGM